MTVVLQLSGEERGPMVGAGQVAIGRGWQRAIGKAQGEAWFLGPLSTGDRIVAVAPFDRGVVMRARSLMTGGAGAACNAQAVATPGTPTTRQALPLPGAPAPATLPDALRGLDPALVTSSGSSGSAHPGFLASTPVVLEASVDESAAGEEPVRAPLRQLPTPPSERAVHVHVERHPDGLHVWFGASSLAADALHRQLDLPALQRALPERFARVVCNGVPLRGSGAVVDPVTWPGVAGHNQEP